MPHTIVSSRTLNYLARRLDELADHFPATPETVELTDLTDDIGMLTSLISYAAETAQERFTSTGPVHPPERRTLTALAHAVAAVTKALGVLADAFGHAAYGYQAEAWPEGPHRDGARSAAADIATEKYAQARALLTATAHDLRKAADTDTGPLPASALPAAALRTVRLHAPAGAHPAAR